MSGWNLVLIAYLDFEIKKAKLKFLMKKAPKLKKKYKLCLISEKNRGKGEATENIISRKRKI